MLQLRRGKNKKGWNCLMSKNSRYIKGITQIALATAIMCVLAQISFYIGPVPITILPLVIAFFGYLLGIKKGTSSVLLYLMMGAVGAPVFSAFNGGLQVLIGYTGGFLWGFLPLVILCGILKERKIGIALGILGIILCHLLGIIQYSLISKVDFYVSLVTVSLPFIIKDIIFIVIAFFLAKKVRKTIKLS